MLCRVFHKGVKRLKNPIPAPELFSQAKKLAHFFCSFGRDRMHQGHSHPDHMEGVDQGSSPHRGIAVIVERIVVTPPLVYFPYVGAGEAISRNCCC